MSLANIPLDLVDSDYIHELAREQRHIPAQSARLLAISKRLYDLEEFIAKMQPKPAVRVRNRTPAATGLTVASIGLENL